MSFRSHARNTPAIGPRRRSLSNSRTSSTNSLPSSFYNGNLGHSSRPLSTGYYPGGQTSLYQSPYVNMYGSRESLYNHSGRNTYYPNGTYDMRYGTNSYGSDRYVSPYSNYDNGITTAGLNLSIPGKAYSQKGSNYSSKANNSKKNDFNSGRNTNLLKSNSLSTSNTSLNSYPSSTKVSVGTNTPTSLVMRSQSLRDQERKSRSRSRNRSAEARSLSASSEKSEGYESGSEKASRSRISSATSLTDIEQSDGKSNNRDTENGELIDYKALWEAVKLENEKLKKELQKKDDELANAKAAVERFTNATSKNSLSELEKRERRALERKLSEMEEELKLLQKLKTENERLRAENRALTRVVSKLTTSAQNQLHKKQ